MGSESRSRSRSVASSGDEKTHRKRTDSNNDDDKSEQKREEEIRARKRSNEDKGNERFTSKLFNRFPDPFLHSDAFFYVVKNGPPSSHFFYFRSFSTNLAE